MRNARRTIRVATIAALAFISTGAAPRPDRQPTVDEALARVAAQPLSMYVTIEGSKQGRFKQETPREKHKDKIPGLAFHYDVKSSTNPASGAAVGRRVHMPIVFTKAVGPSSPQIFQAMVTSEALTTVLFEFVATDKNGEEYVSWTVKLGNASIAGMKQYGGGSPEGGLFNPTDDRVYEDVSLAFQTIEIESKDGKTVASDSWGGGGARPLRPGT